MRVHDFLSKEPDVGGERTSAGYPDECLDFTSFAGSLAALVTEGQWLNNPFTQKRCAVIVDFFSQTQEEAQASLARGWNGAWEFPMGCVNTVRSRVETNEQNALIERHLSLIATGDTMRDFFWEVTERLLDAHSCKSPDCRVCKGRFPRDLAMVFAIFADLGFRTLYLFSQWEPSTALRNVLRQEGIEIQWNPLSAIPAADLEANRYYSIWDGTEKQYDDFMTRFWAPSWQHRDGSPVSLLTPTRAGTLRINLPVPKPEWRSVRAMNFVGTYAVGPAIMSTEQRVAFIAEANRHCLSLLQKMRTMATDPGDFTWLFVPAMKEDGTQMQPAVDACSINVNAIYDEDDPAAKSLWEEWGPRLAQAAAFALPVEPSLARDVTDGDPTNVVVLTHEPGVVELT